VSLRNVDFTDRELLLVVDSLDNATSQDVGLAMGFNGKMAARFAGSRLGWMRKFGFLARDNQGKWFLTDAGERLLRGELPSAITRAVVRATDGQQLLLMRELMKRAYIEGNRETAVAVRREFEHQRARRH
jgi:hypothetical protein